MGYMWVVVGVGFWFQLGVVNAQVDILNVVVLDVVGCEEMC